MSYQYIWYNDSVQKVFLLQKNIKVYMILLFYFIMFKVHVNIFMNN